MRKQARVIERFLEAVDRNLPFDESERDEILEELRGHLADCARAMQERGMDPFDADRAAVERLGSPVRLADELTRARRDASRLLAAAGAGVWGVVRGGVWGGIVGLVVATVGAVVWAVAVNVANRLLGTPWYGFEVATNSLPDLVALGVAAYVAGRVATPAIGVAAGYPGRVVRRVTVPLGAALLLGYALAIWSGPLNWPEVAVLVLLPLWWVAGAWHVRPLRLGFPYRLVMGLLFVLVGCILVGALIGNHPAPEPRSSGSDPGFGRIGAPAPEALAKVSDGGEASLGTGYVELFMDVPDRSLLAGWTDLRIESWRADPMGGARLDPAATGPFLTQPVEWSPAGTSPDGSNTWSGTPGWAPGAATLSGALRLDRSPGVSGVYMAITGVAPDGTRCLLSNPSFAQVAFNGTALDWFGAVLAGR